MLNVSFNYLILSIILLTIPISCLVLIHWYSIYFSSQGRHELVSVHMCVSREDVCALESQQFHTCLVFSEFAMNGFARECVWVLGV